MRRRSFARIITAVAVAAVSCAAVGASADHCGTNTETRNAHDPFGSCEDNRGTPTCGSEGTTTDAASLGRVIVSDQGIQFCWDERHNSFPMRGRLSIYISEGHAGIGADGDETYNAPYGTNGFVRLDVDTETGRACVYGPTQGTWWHEDGGALGAIACAPSTLT